MSATTRRLLGAAAGFFAALAISATVLAHPLGNFTINHYSGLRVSPAGVLVDHVTDFAEIPTFAERRAMDSDGNGDVSPAEAAAYAAATCSGLAAQLALTVDGAPVVLTLEQLGISFPAGQGSPTMRLVCVYRGQLTLPAGAALAFSDTSYAARSGWREITVVGDGATISASDAPAAGTSDRLTHYPADLISVPLGQAQASFTAQPGGPALPPFEVPDAAPLAGNGPAPAPITPTNPGAVPAGATDLTAGVTALFQSPELTPPIILLGLLAAFGLGALHAVSPGHGKTVMAAYLVGSRGNARHALGLGLTVTVSHTIGVLALGGLSLTAAAFIPPERLYPWLTVASGAIVVLIGGYLLVGRVRAWRQRPDHHDAHPAHDDAYHHHSHTATLKPAGWHEHDGRGHTHLPAPTMGRRGLFALGLSGGMIPSVSALLVLIGSISIGRPIYGVALTVAFGLGMASVLVGVGLALVYARRLVERLPVAGSLRIGQRLPLVTAVVVVAAGMLITGQGLLALGL